MKNDLDKSISEDIFAPTSPEKWKTNPNEWLNSTDIQQVMKQWEAADNEFMFLGPSPIDFNTQKTFGECVWEEICNFDIKSVIKKGKNKIGIIFNLDKHTEMGSHWVSLYIDVKKEEIYYFDSYGDPIPAEIQTFADDVKKQGISINNKFDLIINTRVHQRGESECGMYSLYFIIQLINGTPFTHFQMKRTPDKAMLKLRKKYFNSHA